MSFTKCFNVKKITSFLNDEDTDEVFRNLQKMAITIHIKLAIANKQLIVQELFVSSLAGSLTALFSIDDP